MSDSVEIIEYCLAEGADLHSRNNEGWNLLHYAASYGAKRCLTYLIEKKFDVNDCDNDNDTPLHCAAASGSISCINILMQNGATNNAKDNDGYLPLHCAAGSGSKECVDVFLQNDADINIRNNENMTPLHFAAEKGDLSVVELLLEKKADINANNKEGLTPVHIAAGNAHTECLTHFLKQNIDVNVRDTKERTPLHCAANGGSLPTVKFLIQMKADVKARDKLLWTALHFAARNGSMECIKFLIENGAEVNSMNSDNMNPAKLAAEEGHWECFQFLMNYGCSDEAGTVNIQSASEYQDGHNLQIIHTLYPINMTPDDAEKIIQACGIKQGLFKNMWKIQKEELWRTDIAVKKIKVNVKKLNEPSLKEITGCRVVHPSILPLLAAFKIEENESEHDFYFVSPYCEKGDLRSILAINQNFTVKKRYQIALQIAKAIQYLHTPVDGERDMFIHKRISSTHIVLDANWNAKLIDFGHGCHESDYKEREYYSCTSKGGKPTKRWDYFAFGVVLRELLTGLHPKGKDKTYLKDIDKHEALALGQERNWPDDDFTTSFNDVAHVCIAEKELANFSEAVVDKLKEPCPNEAIMSSNKDIDIKICDYCMINSGDEVTMFGYDDSHASNCPENIVVCASCQQLSFRNPMECISCGSALGPCWGALLIAGEDVKSKETANSFILDIKEMASAVHVVFGIRPSNVKVVVPEDGKELVSEIDSAIQKLQNEQVKTLLIYVSCHGLESKQEDYCHFQLGSANLPLREFEDKLQQLSKVMTFVIVLDRCRAPKVNILQRCIIQLNSCKENERSSTSSDGSPFTKYFVQALKGAPSQCWLSNHEECRICKKFQQRMKRFLSVEKIYEYVKEHMKKDTVTKSQTPTLYLSGDKTRLAIFTVEEVITLRSRNRNEFNFHKDTIWNKFEIHFISQFKEFSLQNRKVRIADIPRQQDITNFSRKLIAKHRKNIKIETYLADEIETYSTNETHAYDVHRKYLPEQ